MKYMKIAVAIALATLCSCNSKQGAEQNKPTQDSTPTEQAAAPAEQAEQAPANTVQEDKKEECELCHGTREITCKKCNGEGFFYRPNEQKGEDWGDACIECGGRGYGHKSGNDGCPLTIGKGKLPCPNCVNEIEVEVPQSTNEKILGNLSAAQEAKLVGSHNLRLQWISDTKFGKVEFTKIGDNKFKCMGMQTGEGDDYLRIEGEMSVVNDNHLVFSGSIECMISHIHQGKMYVRKGVMDFVNNKNRRFWRLQQMDNGDCTDYVDIFIAKQ